MSAPGGLRPGSPFRLFPQGQFHVYPAGHGFNCDQRASFNASAADLARDRTLEFFATHLAS